MTHTRIIAKFSMITSRHVEIDVCVGWQDGLTCSDSTVCVHAAHAAFTCWMAKLLNYFPVTLRGTRSLLPHLFVLLLVSHFSGFGYRSSCTR